MFEFKTNTTPNDVMYTFYKCTIGPTLNLPVKTFFFKNNLTKF